MAYRFEERIHGLVDTLLDDYSGSRTIDEIKSFDHPDKEIVIKMIFQLRKIIYPGYFKNKQFKVYTVRNSISMELEDVIYNLIRQISIVLRYIPEYEYADEKTIEDKAVETTFAFIERIPVIREYIETDIEAAFNGDPAAFNKDEIIFSYPGLFAILVNRIAHELHILGVPLIPRIMTEYAHSETGIDIHPGATIGKYQGVTLGALSTRGGQLLKSKKRHPTIEDNVTIYSGASILGGDTVVGKNVVIGGNAFITKSVPEGAKVSIKTQELRINYDSNHALEQKELEQDEHWFYII